MAEPPTPGETGPWRDAVGGCRERWNGGMRTQRAFTILELMISILIIAILLGLLLPLLIMARDQARTTLCAANLKQIGSAWLLYVGDHETFPQPVSQPDWRYGGVTFEGPERRPVLAMDRPLNAYIGRTENPADRGALAVLYQCPSDRGIFQTAGMTPNRRQSVLFGMTCFEFFGTSYRANPNLMDSTKAGIDDKGRPLALHEILVSPSRLLLTADAEWYFATRSPGDPQADLDATWHNVRGAGNMLAVDGSVRFMRFSPMGESGVLLLPRPVRAD